MPLPISAEIHGRLAASLPDPQAAHLLTIGDAAVIFAPRRFLRVAEQILAGDMMMVADLGAAHAAEIFLRPIRASAVEAVRFLWLMRFISKRSCRSSHDAASSALTIVPLAMRSAMNEWPCASDLNTAGTELPPRSRTMTTTLRLPV